MLQTRKSIGARHDSDDDDFKPIKAAAAKRKAPAKPAAPPKRPSDELDVDDHDYDNGKQVPSAPKRKAAAKKPVNDESDFDNDEGMDVEERPAPAPKRKAAAKKPIKDDANSDDEVEEVPVSKKKPPVKATIVDSDSEEVTLPSNSKGKGKEVPKKLVFERLAFL